jgi:hypothetical protein
VLGSVRPGGFEFPLTTDEHGLHRNLNYRNLDYRNHIYRRKKKSSCQARRNLESVASLGPVRFR